LFILIIGFDFSWLQANLILLVDPFCMLGMCCIIPLLESIDSLVQFAQQQDVFTCDLVEVVKICQKATLYLVQ
jgi:hypothetical protein